MPKYSSKKSPPFMSLSCHALSRPNNKTIFFFLCKYYGITKILTKVLNKNLHQQRRQNFFFAILLIYVKYKLEVIAGIHATSFAKFPFKELFFLLSKTVKDGIIKVVSNKYSPGCMFKVKQSFCDKRTILWTPSAFGHPLMCF